MQMRIVKRVFIGFSLRLSQSVDLRIRPKINRADLRSVAYSLFIRHGLSPWSKEVEFISWYPCPYASFITIDCVLASRMDRRQLGSWIVLFSISGLPVIQEFQESIHTTRLSVLISQAGLRRHLSEMMDKIAKELENVKRNELGSQMNSNERG